ncbi:MAG: homoserine dehydrogenase [Candidatus Bathyarchaeia archaeon]
MRIILIGFGSVGQSFLRLLHERGGEVAHNFGLHPRVVAVVDRLGALTDHAQVDYQDSLSSKMSKGSVSFAEGGWRGAGALDVIDEVRADVVVEASSTSFRDGEPALSHIKSALAGKMHVVTTNKAPLAIAMPALVELAEYNGVELRFSGTVGGGTPILGFAKSCLTGNPIRSIRGVLNGTTNYILTKMLDSGVSLKAALDEAQRLGYAETDPSNDLKGLDTACKLVILANYIMGRRVSLRDVKVTGISGVTPEQVMEAKSEGKAIKLIGAADSELTVEPRAIPLSHPLNVSGALNSVVFDTEFSGEITISGKGAGGPETAGAILRDLIEIKRASFLR